MNYRKAFVWSCMLLLGRGYAQEQAQQQAKPPVEAAPAPAEESEYKSDGVGSVSLYYWRAADRPVLATGRGMFTDFNPDFIPTRFEHPGGKLYVPAAEIAFPAKGHTIRLSYFRTQASGTTVAPGDLTLNGSTYFEDDTISASYTLQGAKLSFDYISWGRPIDNPKFKVKTFWELQYVSVHSGFDVPHQPLSYSKANDWLLLPAVGIGLAHNVTKHFRWEAKASGMGFPRRSAVWDAEAYGALRFGRVEFMAGGRAFHFKTSPAKEQYVTATLPGAFIGLRFYP